MTRNLLEYPVTREEVVETLKEAEEKLPKDLIGDLRPYILERTQALVMATDEAVFNMIFGVMGNGGRGRS